MSSYARPRRIMHVIETLAVGGAEVLLAEGLPRLAALGHEVRLRALSLPSTIQLQLRASGIDAACLTNEHGPTKRAMVRAAFRLRRELERHPADIVHTHLFNASLVGRVVALS